MKVKKVIKLVLKILGINLVAVYLIMVFTSYVRMKDMAKIRYSSSAFGVTMSFTEIDLLNKSIKEIKYDMNGKVTNEHTATITDDKLNKFKAACVFSYFPTWRKQYENKNILDGSYWQVVAVYKDGRQKITDGHEANPLTYRFFFDGIQSID